MTGLGRWKRPNLEITRAGMAAFLALGLAATNDARAAPAKRGAAKADKASAPATAPDKSEESAPKPSQEEVAPIAPAEPIRTAEPTPATPPPPAAVPPLDLRMGWKDKLFVESEDKQFYLQPIAIVQTLFTLPWNPSGTPAYEGAGFTFRRAALGLDARFLGFARAFFLSNIASGNLALWDYFTDLDFFGGAAVVRAGRFRPWLGRQRLLAGDRYQMIQLPAAMTDLVLESGDGRDLGAGVFGLLLEKSLEYGFGIWNGEQAKYSNDPANSFLPSSNQVRTRGNIDFAYGGRIVYHPYGYLPAIDESDLAMSESPKLSVGAAFMIEKRHDVRTPTRNFWYLDDRVLKAGLELDFRLRGFSLEAEAFLRKASSFSGPDPNLQSNLDSEADPPSLRTRISGWGKSAYIQSGYFLTPRQLELTARFDYVDIEPEVPGYMVRPALGLNLFLHNYNVLVQLMYRYNAGLGFENDKDFLRSWRPVDRSDPYLGDPNASRPISRKTHDLFLMLQTSL